MRLMRAIRHYFTHQFDSQEIVQAERDMREAREKLAEESRKQVKETRAMLERIRGHGGNHA